MCLGLAQHRTVVPGIHSCDRDKQQDHGQCEEKQLVPEELLGLQSACLLQQDGLFKKP